MKFVSSIIATLFATATVTAAPTPSPEAQSAVADVPQWTIEGLQHVCDAGDNQCTWSFKINTHLADATPCAFTVKRSASLPASQTDTSGNVCGPFTVGAGWSGQFGPGNGFTTFSVVDSAKQLIAWPAYTDKQLEGGKVVSPDLSWPVTSLQF
ncbi:small secreted protein [Daldinia caldariorum]|uniref:small secreted protein n=1 Tax=Daldinia caldariorum TaxID=326644 RepID=UPI002008329F|nr:small secreted protein [Daldinia caldariorum]KAI1472717.1 small secreted protein [Daldinia caldariorum]